MPVCIALYHTEFIKTRSQFHPVNHAVDFFKTDFSPNGRMRKEQQMKEACFPPTDSFSSREIFIMNGCPKEDEKRGSGRATRRRRTRRKMRRGKKKGRDERRRKVEDQRLKNVPLGSTEALKSNYLHNYKCSHACACSQCVCPLNMHTWSDAAAHGRLYWWQKQRYGYTV